MNVEIGAEAAQFPEKEYINGIAVAVQLLAAMFCISMLPYSKTEGTTILRRKEGA
jgi:hypothetical protein